jgi:hypothetical protein
LQILSNMGVSIKKLANKSSKILRSNGTSNHLKAQKCIICNRYDNRGIWRLWGAFDDKLLSNLRISTNRESVSIESSLINLSPSIFSDRGFLQELPVPFKRPRGKGLFKKTKSER